jgi:hypothetical protein
MTSTISCRTRKTCTNYPLLQRQLSETNSPARPLLVLSSLQRAHKASRKHYSKTHHPLLSTKPLLSNPPTLINSSHNLLSPYQKNLPNLSQQSASSQQLLSAASLSYHMTHLSSACIVQQALPAASISRQQQPTNRIV